jgi:hypothetical protein
MKIQDAVLISPAGSIYISLTSNSSSGAQSAPITGTIVSSTPVAMPTGAPQSKIPAITSRADIF